MRSNNRRWWLTGSALLFLASCGSEQSRVSPAAGPTATGPAPATPNNSGPNGAVLDEPVKIGPPYQIRGVTYTPAAVAGYDEVGYATWYGEEAVGQSTANGEAFVPAAITGAHRTLPMPSYVEVTALDTGRTILVRINDRGPFASDRIIDLSRGAAEQLGVTGDGAAAVRVRLVNPPEQEKALLRAHARAPQRIATPQSLLKALRARLAGPAATPMLPGPAPRAQPATSSHPPGAAARAGASFDIPPATAPASARPAAPTGPKPAPSVPATSHPAGRGYVVQVAALSSRSRADALAKRIGASVVAGTDIWRVRYGPYPTQAAAHAGVKAAAAKGFENARIMANDAR